MYLSTSIGAVIGMAGSSAVLQTMVHHGLKVVVGPDVENREEFMRQCLEDLEFIQQLKGVMKERVVSVYLMGFRGAYSKLSNLFWRRKANGSAVMSLILSALGTLMGLFIRERSLT